VPAREVRASRESIQPFSAVAREMQRGVSRAPSRTRPEPEGEVMHKFQKTIDIKAPVQKVWEFITLPTNMPGVWPSMISVANLVPKGDGTHDFDWIYKMAGVHFHGQAKVEASNPGKLAVVRCTGGIPSVFRWGFAANGTGTRLSLEVEYSLPTPLIGKIVEAIVAKSNEREMELMLANTKDMLEHQTAGVAVGAAAH
jgi:ligand-binding SRPBCC domain-containing protein